MTTMQLVAAIVLSLVLPFALQLIKNRCVDGDGARWMALAVSLAAGVFTGLIGGIPSEPGEWLACIFSVVGGVQAAYTLFRQMGVTNKWLEALMGVNAKPCADGIACTVNDANDAAAAIEDAAKKQ